MHGHRGETLVAIVTRDSVGRLGLKVGAPVTVLIKASSLFSQARNGRFRFRPQSNQGPRRYVEPDAEHGNPIGHRRRQDLTAIVTAASARELGYKGSNSSP